MSTDEFSRFDPARGAWLARTPLPSGRSSHDAVVVDGVLYVIGGWNLGKDRIWHDDALKIRLNDPQAKWEELPKQTFRRRALAVAAFDNKLYALGGMTEDAKPSNAVDVFDLKQNRWLPGPELPGMPIDSFGCAAAALPSGLYVTAMDGRVLRLSADGKQWYEIGRLQTPRFFHRLLPVGSDTLLVVGGASHSGHLASLEWFTPGATSKE